MQKETFYDKPENFKEKTIFLTVIILKVKYCAGLKLLVQY